MMTDRRRSSGAGPTRFCPSCYARNPWTAASCEVCGLDLESGDDFDAKLVWALHHPEPATACRAADLLAARRTVHAVPDLVEVAEGSTDPYIAAAAARALLAFPGDAAALVALDRLRHHDSVLVRRALASATPAAGEG